ncbi:MAG TPA: class II aldolase/adducin family protein [Methanomassiliicoccales archaeon]|nr:class II aldolase/adducin family protein [Methanomassiliicoccales archaeon]
MMSSESSLRMEMVRFGRLMSERGLTFATGGNLSVRLDEETVLITPSGVRKGEMRGDDLIVMNLSDGSFEGHGKPSIEAPLHTIFYKRKDVNAVLHGHPPFCTILAVTGKTLKTALIPEGILVLGRVPLVPYRTPGSVDLASSLMSAKGDGKGYLMEKHGALAVGADLGEAFNRLEEMEFIASIQVRVEKLGGAEELPDEEIEKILRL